MSSGGPHRTRRESDIEPIDLEAVQSRFAAATPGPWVLADSGPDCCIVLAALHGPIRMYVRRDVEPAGREDIEFIAHLPDDVGFLLSALVAGFVRDSDAVRISEIESRATAATPGPWWEFLESRGGLGGSSMISVRSDEFSPDIYLWRETEIAPDADIEFVAHARQDVPHLVAAVRSLPPAPR
jgi:hypothetical protein